MIRRVAFLLCVLGLAPGCIVSQTGLPDEKPDWIIGKTTRKEVLRSWGNPGMTFGDTMIWTDAHVIGSKFRIGYFGIGATFGNKRLSTWRHALTFDGNGVLVKMESDNTAGKQPPTWSANPFED